MANQTVEVMVEGGKATSGPTMGQAFGSLGVNIQLILQEINKKTADFKGMKVPVAVTVDTGTKQIVDITVGTPPVSELIKKEINLQKGSGYPHVEKVGNLAIEQVIKIAKMKRDSLLEQSLKSAVKSVIGSCGSLGILVEDKEPKEINKDIEAGNYDELINKEVTEVSEEKRSKLKSQVNIIKQKLIAERGMPVKKEEKKAAAPAAEGKKEEKKEEKKEKKEEKKKK